jgi:hypothetical protein
MADNLAHVDRVFLLKMTHIITYCSLTHPCGKVLLQIQNLLTASDYEFKNQLDRNTRSFHFKFMHGYVTQMSIIYENLEAKRIALTVSNMRNSVKSLFQHYHDIS